MTLAYRVPQVPGTTQEEKSPIRLYGYEGINSWFTSSNQTFIALEVVQGFAYPLIPRDGEDELETETALSKPTIWKE